MADIRRPAQLLAWSIAVAAVVSGGTSSRASTIVPRGADTRAACDAWRATDGRPDGRNGHTAVWTGTEMIVWGGYGGHPYHETGGRFDPATGTWRPMTTVGAPAARVMHRAVWTGTEMIVWGGYASVSLHQNTGGRYSPATDTWVPTSTGWGCPAPRTGHSAVWTGTEMVVWGGGDYVRYYGDGAAYDPVSNVWRGIAADSPRSAHGAVWTGREMIVWGGSSATAWLQTGARYDPLGDRWTPTSTGAGCPSARVDHATLWTGTEMVVWGGNAMTGLVSTGARYDPAADAWTVMTSGRDCPSPRDGHAMVWTGSQVVVWGGYGSPPAYLSSGARYDPATDSWAATSTGGACPSARSAHTAVWTGSKMLVWGGNSYSDGGRYDPSSDSWAPIELGNVPTGRSHHTSVWTGTELIVWGGQGGPTDLLDTGGRYVPATNTWSPTSAGGAPSRRWKHTAVWTGSEMVVWGGWGPSLVVLDTGGRYAPATDSWTPTATGAGCPSARREHTAVWTGREMVVWGGAHPAQATGGRYDPVSDLWSPTSTGTGCPERRAAHTAVWTGTEMVVWGGYANGVVWRNGGRYDPGADTWRPVSLSGSPTARLDHEATWTGTQMMVWGGDDLVYGPVDTGGLYDPLLDAWRSTSTGTSCPAGRWQHTLVSTGIDVLVWGGRTSTGDTSTGGIYAPATDTWRSLPVSGEVPSPRTGHAAEWTGSAMIVWGGYPFYTATGGVFRSISVIPGALPAAAWGVPYRTTVGARGGSAPYNFSVASGALPAGLSLDPVSGEITGRPSQGGRFPLEVAADDAAGCRGTRLYVLDVACLPVSLAPLTLPDGRATGSYAQTLAASGGTPPYSFQVIAGQLPPGLALSPSGILSGTPGSAGAHAFEVLATDAFGCSGRRAYALLIEGRLDWLLGAGLGAPNPPSVMLFTASGSPTPVTFSAYGVSQWGANVVAGDVDGGAFEEILTGPGPGTVSGPHVRGWGRTGTSLAKVSFYAYGTLQYGVNVARGDVDDDGYHEILTGAGPAAVFGPHVRGFGFDGIALSSIAKLTFYAYGTLKFGVNVAGGSVDGDGYEEIVCGPGPGPAFAPQIRGFDVDGGTPSTIPKLDYVALPYAGHGVNVALGDVDDDRYAEIASAPGPGPPHPSRFLGHGYDGTVVAPLPGFDIIPFSTGYGARVGVGDLEIDGREDLLGGAGRDPAADSTAKGYRYTASQLLQPLPVVFTPFGSLRYGVNLAAGGFDY